MLAANPALTPEQIRVAFLNGVDVINSMQGKVATNVSVPPCCHTEGTCGEGCATAQVNLQA